MRLTVVLPGNAEPFMDLVRRECARWVPADTELDLVMAGDTASIASRYEMAKAAPAILDAVVTACHDGTDGIFVACAGDPAVDAAREIADVPVAGGFQPALMTAVSLGWRVGVISVLRNVVPVFRELARREGLENRCQEIRVIDAPVLDPADHAAMVDLLFQHAAAMVDGGRADAIVLGCTGFIGAAEAVQDRLAARGAYVPVVDPTGAALLWLQSCVRLRVRPSRTTYAPPQEMTWAR